MCGLFGYYSSEQKIQNEILLRAVQELQHRGPDSQQTWISKDGLVGFGHTRLSTVDLRNIPCPLTNESQSVFLIANGEFYNHQMIRSELLNKGHVFSTQTDSEIALHLYEDEGIACLSKLRGEFAFLLWDNNNRTLFAARDRFGVKPLYYTVYKNNLFLSSEVPALFKAGLPANWDKEALLHYVHFNLDSNRTLYDGIYQVPAGHYLMANRHGVRIVRYWDLNYPLQSNESNHLSEEEWTAQLRDKLTESVKLRLQADVPVGFYLSGGIDSAALLGIGSALSTKPLDAFSICFTDEQVNEATYARETADFNGARFNPVQVSEQDIVDHFAHAVVRAASPMGNAAGVARYLLSRHTRDKGYKVVLSGEGADEIFLGYNYMRLEALQDAEYKKSIDNVDEFIAKMNAAFPVDRSKMHAMPQGFHVISSTMGYEPRWITTQAYLNHSHRNMLAHTFLAQFESYNPYRVFLNNLDVESQIKGRAPLIQSLYIWLKAFFPNNLLNWVGDRAEMAHSISARHPYLDHHLFEFAKHIPIHLKISGKTEKHILREAVKPFVSKNLHSREKFMFQAPPIRMASESKQYEMLNDVVRSHIHDMPYYDSKKVLAYLDSSRSLAPNDRLGLADLTFTLTTLGSFAILQQAYKLGF